VVSDKFKDVKLIQRHRMITELIKEELQQNFPHALSIVAKDPNEYDKEYKLEPSPNCKGGFGK
jgi:BolA protein